MMIAELPTEIQLMIAHFYFVSRDAPFYTKWCLAKCFDKHFGTNTFNEIIETLLPMRRPVQSEYHRLPSGKMRWVGASVTLALPELVSTDNYNCLVACKSHVTLSNDTSVISKRYLQCLECQRHQPCTQRPIKLSIWWSSATTSQPRTRYWRRFYKQGLKMSVSIHHPQHVVDDETETTVIYGYHPFEWCRLHLLEEFKPEDGNIMTRIEFREVVKRYDLHRLLK